MPLHKNTLNTQSFKLLENINSHPNFKNFYLAGGTSLALQIGHRESIDLDFFSQDQFPSNLIEQVQKPYQTIGIHNNSIEVIMENTKTFFFYFAFPRFKDIKIIQGIRFADPIDIGLMKLLALQGRTTRKDIIDLFFIDKEIINLEDLMEIFQYHYPKEKFNSIDSIKTLIDSSVLDSQPMPKMLVDFNWEESKIVVIEKLIKSISKYLIK